MTGAGPGIPLVIAAPSGTGKTSVCRRLLEIDANVEFSVSHTTRPIRDGERNGMDYHFVDTEEFRRMVDAGEFLEWAEYGGNFYGTSWQAIEGPLAAGRDLLLEIEVQGARQVRERLTTAGFVFLLPPSLESLQERLEGRKTDTPEQVAKRLAIAQTELAAIEEFDFAIVNDEVEDCARDLCEILRARRAGDPNPVEGRFDPRAAAERFRYASTST